MDMPKTYRSAGVDIDAGNELARRIGRLAKSTHRQEIVSGIGGFAGISAIPGGYKDPLLVSGTDGVGTKLKLAFLTKKHHTVGIDLVAMAVNDIVTVGAEPLFFLDYFATGKLDVNTAESVISGIVEGCRQAECTLLGGETAEMPGMYPDGEYDLAGFAVGVVERSRLIDGTNIQPGDQVIGLPSSGLHSNGYSLARKVLLTEGVDLQRNDPILGCSLGEALLEPTRIYVAALKEALNQFEVRGIAHITGGGLIDNPPRIIKDHLAFRLFTSTWSVPAIFTRIAQQGAVPLEEMRRTFNMGLGMLIVLPTEQAEQAAQSLKSYDARIVGEIVKRNDSQVEFQP